VKLLGLRMSVKIIERSCVPWSSETFQQRPLWSHVAFVRDNKQDKHSDAHGELGKSRGTTYNRRIILSNWIGTHRNSVPVDTIEKTKSSHMLLQILHSQSL